MALVRQHRYWAEYHGHPVEDLRIIIDSLRAQGRSLVYLAGDSSLDNQGREP